ncbi:hypothetical protein C8Q76DRAFT_41112 [Earliella scabrosa]|nr:hypothetical protein C8Q76DRAFT_41112 [Earliella scabrosa]
MFVAAFFPSPSVRPSTAHPSTRPCLHDASRPRVCVHPARVRSSLSATPKIGEATSSSTLQRSAAITLRKTSKRVPDTRGTRIDTPAVTVDPTHSSTHVGLGLIAVSSMDDGAAANNPSCDRFTPRVRGMS